MGDVKKMTGYVVSVVGILVMAVGFNIFPVDWELFNIIPMKYIGGLGVALVGVGVLISLMGGSRRRRARGGEDEVPIFEGVGKRRRVVGYRKG